MPCWALLCCTRRDTKCMKATYRCCNNYWDTYTHLRYSPHESWHVSFGHCRHWVKLRAKYVLWVSQIAWVQSSYHHTERAACISSWTKVCWHPYQRVTRMCTLSYQRRRHFSVVWSNSAPTTIPGEDVCLHSQPAVSQNAHHIKLSDD